MGGVHPNAALEQQLSRRVGDVVLAPHDVRDTHQRIVDHHGEVIRGHAIGPHQQLDRRSRWALKRTSPSHHVVEHHVALARHSEIGWTAFSPSSMRRRAASRVTERQRPLYIGGRPAASARCRSASSSSAVQKQWYASPRDSSSRRALDNVQSLRLAIRAVVATSLHALVPRETQPPKVVEIAASDTRVDRSKSVSSMRSRSGHRCARQQPVEERRPRVADMQLARGARSEPHAHGMAGRAGHRWRRATAWAAIACPDPSHPRLRWSCP